MNLHVAWLLFFGACSGGTLSVTDPETTEPAVVPTTAAVTPDDAPETTVSTTTPPFTGEAERLQVQVLERFEHDTEAFTQGLVAIDGGFYESTGNYGESDLRQVSASGEVIRSVALDEAFFAEGLELHDGRLIQLTWRESTAFIYDEATFELVDTHTYDGEGWGLCSDGSQFIMSNGSDSLTFRDHNTFAATGSIQVTVDGVVQENLNELECVDGRVYANVWQTDLILRIDPRTGAADQVIDASGLLSADEAEQANVLNGIAYAGDDEFFITGKLWPALFRVTFG